VKIVKLAVAAAVAASALMAGPVAMGGMASAGTLSARTTAHDTPAAHVTHPAGQAAATGAWGKAHLGLASEPSTRAMAPG